MTDQMTRDDVNSADEALAYALQTHLCYSGITPTDSAFGVFKRRLDSTGYDLVVRTHAVPKQSAIMPCCGQLIFEHMRERVTLDPELVTCNASA